MRGSTDVNDVTCVTGTVIMTLCFHMSCLEVVAKESFVTKLTLENIQNLL